MCYVRFCLSFLISGDAAVISKAMETKGVQVRYLLCSDDMSTYLLIRSAKFCLQGHAIRQH